MLPKPFKKIRYFIIRRTDTQKRDYKSLKKGHDILAVLYILGIVESCTSPNISSLY